MTERDIFCPVLMLRNTSADQWQPLSDEVVNGSWHKSSLFFLRYGNPLKIKALRTYLEQSERFLTQIER